MSNQHQPSMNNVHFFSGSAPLSCPGVSSLCSEIHSVGHKLNHQDSVKPEETAMFF